MSKFKFGDVVIPEKFKRDDLGFAPRMDEFIGKPNHIEKIDDTPYENHYCVHGCWWPEGALKLADDKPRCQYEQHINEYFGREMFKERTTLIDIRDAVQLLNDFDKKSSSENNKSTRKTLGDFMLAALTGLCSNPISEARQKDEIVTEAHDIAQRAFRFYEKEVEL